MQNTILPHSLVIFIPAAIAAFVALIVYRRRNPAKPDPHMKFITVAAVVPYALMPLFSVDFFKAELRSLPIWFVYWTFADIVYHLVLKLPDAKRRIAAGAVFAALLVLFAFGVFERV